MKAPGEHHHDRRGPGVRAYILLGLAALVLLSAAGYSWLEGMSFFEALYLTVVTVTTVGYGDIAPETPGGRVLTLFLVPLGLVLVFGLGLSVFQEQLMDLVLRGGAGRLERTISNLRGHYIVCGYGRLGRGCAAALRRLGGTVVVVERDRQKVREAADKGMYFLVGDALEEEVLRRAGIERARAVISTFSDDTLNVYLTLEARDIRRDIEVISAAGGREASRRLYLAGATRVISPFSLGAELLAKSAVNPSILQMMSDVISTTTPGESISQLPVAEGSPLVGKELRELPAMGVQVRVMLVRQGGTTHLSPLGSFRIESGAVLAVVGESEELQKLERLAAGRS